ncbi:hypothetical protein K466DRAFT_662742 [Polyporus arcularius HHB13444]|uniref:Uncharacterized protein n=1 Tax=Polyporus arcularius HHB13444 TaxID=1314778 RepID=A0A5C3PG73_9APHY|nr:hypothetical protein K466DRAFT_662742 [Polyporus arcularius HHB13444]
MNPPSPCDDDTFPFYKIFLQSQQSVNAVITASVFGSIRIATCLAIASVYILIARGVKERSTALQLATILILYTSTAVFAGAVLCAMFTIVNLTNAAANAIAYCDVKTIVFYPDSESVDVLGDRMRCIQTGTLVVNIIVGDAVVWWRVYMLWAGVKAKQVILGVSVMLLTATFLSSVVNTWVTCISGGNVSLFGTTFGVVAASMSLVTNVVATCFTAYRAWAHVQTLKHFSRKLIFSGAEQILILLAESGFVYSAIWVVVVVWQGDEDISDNVVGARFWSVVGYFVDGGLVPVIAIYPMFIILMVALKRTCQTNATHMFPTQIRFESQPVSPRLPTAQGERLNSNTRELVLSSSSVIEAGTSNSDLSMEELGKDVELREDVLIFENYTV